MQKTEEVKGRLVTFLATCLLAGCATNTRWVDATGQSRPEWQFQQDMAACQQRGSAVLQQYQNQMQSAVANTQNPRQAAFVVAATDATAIAEADVQINACMTEFGWAKQKINAAPHRITNAATLAETTDTAIIRNGAIGTIGAPASSLESVHIGVWFITIPTREWREYPPRKTPDTLSFLDNKIISTPDGALATGVMMNYDKPNKLFLIGTVQSVLFNVAFRCDSDKAKSNLVRFYTGKDASGTLLKQFQNVSIHIKPHSVEKKMQDYVCASIAGR